MRVLMEGLGLAGRDVRGNIVPVENPELAVEGLDERRQAFDPVAVVAVEHAVDIANFGLVDVAADDAVETALARLAGDRFLERRDVADRVLDFVLEKLRQRPVGQVEPGAQGVEVVVEPQRQRVEPVAEKG